MKSPRLSNIEAIFLDDGGVLSDNSLRGPQWRRMSGEYFPPRFGGTRPQWEQANVIVATEQSEKHERGELFPVDGSFNDAWRKQEIGWLRAMFELVGVDAPADDDEAFKMARAAIDHIAPQIHAAIPGSADAIRTLHRGGYRLYMASSAPSVDLVHHLDGLGVADLIHTMYGTDLVDTWKGSSRFYDRIFEDSGVSPDSALVVEDTNRAVSWAAAAGAKTVLISPTSPANTDGDVILDRLADLPQVLANSTRREL